MCECFNNENYHEFLQSHNEFIKKVDKDKYSALRRNLLPPNSVIQENENLDFLDVYATFYDGNDFILAISNENTDEQNDTLNCIEILGCTDNVSAIVSALGFKDGVFRTPSGNKPMAMCLKLDSGNELDDYSSKDIQNDIYIGFLFD